MRAFRIFPFDRGAAAGEPGHPLFIARSLQGSGRWDNPDRYAAGYFSLSARGAVSEVFGGMAVWRPALFDDLPISRRLGEFEIPDDLELADFDDPAVLSRFELRVADVGIRDPRRTQQIAARVHDAGLAGIRWPSLYHPGFTNLVVFDSAERGVTFLSAERLSIEHPAVFAAAERIVRHITR